MLKGMLTMVNVSDMARSVQFYRDTLGLKMRFESPEWSEFDVEGTTLALHGGGKPPATPPASEVVAGTANVGFSVDNLDEVCTQLKSRGVRFVMPPTLREGEGIRLAVLVDPDGCAISIAAPIRK